MLPCVQTSDYYDLMYPAWSFWSGGPAISTEPRGLGRWDTKRNSITKLVLFGSLADFTSHYVYMAVSYTEQLINGHGRERSP